ncbi:hypothetical protein BG011_007590 [Mortierella polycephala]|uniref:Copper acquisition factor BIM1-like domain-containing protein n=1 Tax=Mortierella polycephala TaxID=41804 RepID=A0A9P6TY40_9FUNG|nr:hypothetical protein BG011_007590 [Mortierella polycephala]
MAHFTLDYPSTRGLIEAQEPTAPCGGFDTVGARTQFPLTKGFIQIDSGHPRSEVKVNVVYGDNPSAADFTTAAGTPAASLSVDHPGNVCVTVDLADFKGAADNINATIQVVYNGGDSPLYQCTDVVLVTSAEGFDQTKCVNEQPTSAAAAISVKNAATAVVAVVMAAAMAL